MLYFKLYLTVVCFLFSFQFVPFTTAFTINIPISIKPVPHSCMFCSNSTHLPQRRVPKTTARQVSGCMPVLEDRFDSPQMRTPVTRPQDGCHSCCDCNRCHYYWRYYSIYSFLPASVKTTMHPSYYYWTGQKTKHRPTFEIVIATANFCAFTGWRDKPPAITIDFCAFMARQY